MDEYMADKIKQIGARMKEIRIEKRMSQQELADRAGISLPHVSEIERGNHSMRLTTFIRLAEALQVSADALLRLDIPEVNEIYQGEFYEMLKDCSPAELDSILKIVKEIKTSFRKQSNTDE